MAAVIRIKRSNVSGNPATLRAGELAYSALTDNGSNGGDRLYIGMGTETAGNAANHFVIGGKFFTDRLDHTAGTLTASKALVVDSNKKLDELLVDNLSLNGNTISTTDTNGNLTLTPNGTGKVSIAGAYTLPRIDGTAGYVLTTDGSGTVSWQGSGLPTFTVTTATAGVSALSYSNGVFTFTPPDLSSYATQTYVTTQGYITTSSLTGLASETFVTTQGYITTSSLTGLASETFVTGQGYITTSSLTGLATESYVTGQGYITTSSLTGLATESYVTGQGYITTSSLTGLATESYVTGQGYITTSSLTGLASETFVTSQGYATTASVNTLIANSLTNYATQTYVTTQGYITSSALTGLASETFVTTQGYITSSALTGLASETFVTTQGYITTSSLVGLATESYVQSVAQGLHIHKPVNAATTATLASITGGSVTYNNGTSGIGATLTLGVALTVLDGYTLQNGDRVLVKNESAAANNGIYSWATGGTVLTRTVFEDEITQFAGGDFFFVSNGTVNGDSGWVQTENISSFGSSNIIFQQFAGAGTFQAGTGLSLAGNIFNVNPGAGIAIVNNAVAIASTYSGGLSISTVGTITQGNWTAEVIGTAYGGTGKSTYNPYDLLVGTTASNSLMTLALGTAGQVLQVNADGNQLVYGDLDGGSY
jgi:hypothetical protein